MAHQGHKKLFVTDAKVRKAYEALDNLLICDDLQETFDTASVAVVVAAKRALSSELQERGII